MASSSLIPILKEALQARDSLLDPGHLSAVRLFNGFTEGFPDLVVDLYADTAVFHNYADSPERCFPAVELAQRTVQEALPWIRASVVKTRLAAAERLRRGVPTSDRPLARRIREGGLWYALDLILHRDCSLYLDTRNLRRWAREHLTGKTVLNVFAYTGSLGVAALGAGAERVIQLDRNKRFLDLARSSYALNGFPVRPRDFLVADFFRQAGALRRRKEAFDCVFLDPPYFASSPGGTVDLQRQSARLINKVRPLVRPGGLLCAVNNAVYVSGADYMRVLGSLCQDGHLQILDQVPVPDDFVGFLRARAGPPITDPSPFNHSTKIAILRAL